MRSAGPPSARRRAIISVSAGADGMFTVEATVTLLTQPSTRASTVSSRASVASCCGVISGLNTPEASASWTPEGSVGSRSLAMDSMRSMSMWISEANAVMRSSTCWRSHGTPWNRRACAASRMAR